MPHVNMANKQEINWWKLSFLSIFSRIILVFSAIFFFFYLHVDNYIIMRIMWYYMMRKQIRDRNFLILQINTSSFFQELFNCLSVSSIWHYFIEEFSHLFLCGKFLLIFSLSLLYQWDCHVMFQFIKSIDMFLNEILRINWKGNETIN